MISLATIYKFKTPFFNLEFEKQNLEQIYVKSKDFLKFQDLEWKEIKKNRESQWILNEKRRLLELWGSGTISEQQYKVPLAQLDFGMKQARLDKEKITPG